MKIKIYNLAAVGAARLPGSCANTPPSALQKVELDIKAAAQAKFNRRYTQCMVARGNVSSGANVAMHPVSPVQAVAMQPTYSDPPCD